MLTVTLTTYLSSDVNPPYKLTRILDLQLKLISNEFPC